MGAPQDKYELQAERVAAEVMKMPASKPAMIDFLHGADPVQPECAACGGGDKLCPECAEELRRQPNEEDEELQAKATPGQTASLSPALEANIDSLRGGGQPLSASERAFFEPRFETNFSAVRVHTGSGAGELAQSLNARAFTVGSDIVFGQGEYSPSSSTSLNLLAHELTHVVQQEGAHTEPSVMQRSPLVCADKFPQEDKIYGGEATKETVGKRDLKLGSNGKADPTTLNSFHTTGLRDYPELRKILGDNNLSFDNDTPLEAKDCSPGPGLRFAYSPVANAIGLEAVEFCQKGDYLYFKFVCVAPPAGGEMGQQPVIKEYETGVEVFDLTGKRVGDGYITEDGYITMKIRTEDTSLRGGDVFNAIYDKLQAKGGSIKGVKGVWTTDPGYEKNLADFNKAIKDGESPKDAALKGTFTGVMCGRRGLIPKAIYVEAPDGPEVRIENIETATKGGGPFSSVIVFFE